MSELPVSADGIVAGEDAAVASVNLERNGLPCNLGAACPHNSPVAGHSDPSGILPLDVDGADVTSTSDVVNEDHHEVGVAVQLEPHSTSLGATHPVFHKHHITYLQFTSTPYYTTINHNQMYISRSHYMTTR